MPQAEGGLPVASADLRLGVEGGPLLSLRDISPRSAGESGSPKPLQLLNDTPHLLYNPPMASFNPLHWRRTTRSGGLSERAAEDTAAQLQDAFAHTSSRQDLRDIVDAALAKHDLRIIQAMIAIVGIATAIIIAANRFLGA